MLYAIAIALSLLQAFDGWTTYQIHKRGGSDKNPVVRWLIGKLGLYPALVLLKACAAGLVWLLVLLPVVDGVTSGMRLALLAIATSWYVWVAWNNWSVYRGGSPR